MSKSVLVIDTPIDCEDCPLYDADLMRCHYLKNEAYGVDALPKWCPLKPMPKRSRPQDEQVDNLYRLGLCVGWNACIDYLEVETE